MKSWLRPLAETVAVYGLIGWLYVAAVAAARPQDLAVPIVAIVPLRRDTFGALCFGLSAASAFALQLGPGPLWTRVLRRRGPLDAVLRTVCGYALLAWVYLCVNSLTHPYTIPRRLVHFAASPAEGTVADLGFAASAVCLFALRLRGRVSRGGDDGG
ncbi:MAG: hypothetical protein ACRDVE_04060 [Actinocrinis sp.]